MYRIASGDRSSHQAGPCLLTKRSNCTKYPHDYASYNLNRPYLQYILCDVNVHKIYLPLYIKSFFSVNDLVEGKQIFKDNKGEIVYQYCSYHKL